MLSPSNLVVAALLVVQVSCQFNRTCENANDCKFMILRFGCDHGACVCESPPLRADAPNYKLVSFGGNCIMVEEEGPCGFEDGLNIVCSDGYKCIQDRCRDPESVGKGQDGDGCQGDIDCDPTLRCAFVRFSFQAVRACKPKNFKDWGR